MHGRSRGNGGAPIQCFSLQRFEICPIARRFDVPGFYDISYSLIPPRGSIFFEISTESERWGQPNPGRSPRRAVSAASSVLSSLFAAQLVLCCCVEGNQDVGPSARKRRRANPLLLSAALRDFTDSE